MSFTHLFYQHIMFRQSCGKCHYTNLKRPSDITIADFWGWEKTVPDINKDDKGISLILINTDKGKQLFENVKDKMNVYPSKLEDCMQTHLQQPTVLHLQSHNFVEDYKRRGFEYVYYKYVIPQKTMRFKIILKMKIKIFVNRLRNIIDIQ